MSWIMGKEHHGGMPDRRGTQLVISQFASKFGAGVAALAVLGSIASTSLPATAHSAPAASVVADAQGAGNACGTIEIGGATADAAAIRSAADCLQRAYSSCSPNQLVVTWDNATERIDRVLTISAPDQGGCQIVDQVTRTAKSSGLDSSNVYTCGGLTADAKGLTVSKCGMDGDVVVPTAG
jgi:hypothetical protein